MAIFNSKVWFTLSGKRAVFSHWPVLCRILFHPPNPCWWMSPQRCWTRQRPSAKRDKLWQRLVSTTLAAFPPCISKECLADRKVKDRKRPVITVSTSSRSDPRNCSLLKSAIFLHLEVTLLLKRMQEWSSDLILQTLKLFPDLRWPVPDLCIGDQFPHCLSARYDKMKAQATKYWLMSGTESANFNPTWKGTLCRQKLVRFRLIRHKFTHSDLLNMKQGCRRHLYIGLHRSV